MNGRRLALALLGPPLAYLGARLALAGLTRRFETLDPEGATLPAARFYLRGRRIHLTIDGKGPPLLLVHGLGASALIFHRLVPHLRHRYTLIAPDLPGHGFSERSPSADHSHRANAMLLLALLDRLGIERAAVLGHASGAAIAVHIAAAAPDRVPALVLAGAPGRPDPVAALLRPLLPLILPLLVRSRSFVRRLTQRAVAPGTPLDEDLLEEHLLATRVRGHAATLHTILAKTRQSPLPRPRDVSMPVLLIAAEQDGNHPPHRAKALAGRLPQGRTVTIPGAGNLPAAEQLAAGAGAILSFLDELPAARTSTAPRPAQRSHDNSQVLR